MDDLNVDTLNLDLLSIESNVPYHLSFKASSSAHLNFILDKFKKIKINDADQQEKSVKLLFRASYFILKNNFLNRNDTQILVKKITHFFPIQFWLYPNNFIYGSSNILLGLISIKDNYLNPQIKEYLSEVSERILKKMEISQQRYFHYENSPQTRTLLILEQLKLIYFLLLYYEKTKDIRFLNAVLKANDRLFPFFKKINFLSNSNNTSVNILLASYYVKVIELQEVSFSRLL